MNKKFSIDLNKYFVEAINRIESGKNIFITGRAGTGKSTLLHHFFGFGPDITLRRIKKRISEEKAKFFKGLSTIVIDEISMVRADLLDCVDAFLRLHGPKKGKSFGGVQMVFIGDLYQLPPVVTSQERNSFSQLYESPYFFSARSFAALEMDFIELEKVYRQKDDRFIKLLNSIRNKTADQSDYQKINERYNADFEPPKGEPYISLTSTNADADKINEKEMGKLPGKELVLEGEVEGNFPQTYLPAALMLKIKEGAQIMMLNNDSLGRWVNGSVGEITKIDLSQYGQPEMIEVKLSDGARHFVTQNTWDLYDFYLNGDREIDSKKIGSFTQFPFRVAFAVTIHKAQGKTFDKLIIDIGRGTFAHGQMYVALSRATSLEGIVLKKPVLPKHVWLDWAIVRFITKYQYSQSAERISTDDKIKIINEAIVSKKNLEITYLKAKDVKSRRFIRPTFVGELDNILLSNRLLKGAHKVLLSHGRGKNKHPGDFRKSQNWIGGLTPSDAVFVPPSAEHVDELMSDLEKFLHNEEIQVPDLIKIAIAHYQFETIHPFLDGNGRVGRLLIVLYLVDQGIIEKPLLYISDFFEKNRELYYDKLSYVRQKNDLAGWIAFFLDGIALTADTGAKTLRNIIALKEKISILIIGNFGKRAKLAHEFLDYLFAQPVVTIQQVKEKLDVANDTAYSLVNVFVKHEILKEVTGSKRNRLFIFEAYLNLLKK